MEQPAKIILTRRLITLEIMSRQPISLTSMQVYKLGGDKTSDFNCGYGGGGPHHTAKALHYIIFGRIGFTQTLLDIVAKMPMLSFEPNSKSETTFNYTPFQLAYGTKFSDENLFGENPIRPFETIHGLIESRKHLPDTYEEYFKTQPSHEIIPGVFVK